jgi:hypothetical protein
MSLQHKTPELYEEQRSKLTLTDAPILKMVCSCPVMAFDEWRLVRSLLTSINTGGKALVSLEFGTSKAGRFLEKPATLFSSGGNAFDDFAVTDTRVINMIVIVKSTKVL